MAKITIAQKEIGLYYCLGAAKELSKITGGLNNIKDYMVGDASEILDKMANVIVLLNQWYAKAAACNGIKVEPVDKDWLDLYMGMSDMTECGDAIIEAMNEGTSKAIEVKPVPSKNAKSGGSKKKSS